MSLHVFRQSHWKWSFDGNTYVNSKEEKRPGIIIDNDLLFDGHVKDTHREKAP